MQETSLKTSLTEAHAQMTEGKFGEARTKLLRATKAYPESAEAWKILGISENKLGNHESAERYLRKSLRIDDTDADAWSSLGGVYVSMMRYEDALKCYERNVSDGSADTYALLNYLTMRGVVGDDEPSLDSSQPGLSAGKRLCEAQIEEGVNIPWCYFDLAQILFFEGRRTDFKSCVRDALRRSTEWQVASARRTYELLAKSGRLSGFANEALSEFDGHRPEKL